MTDRGFGPATGNGFAELARYDDDNNGWIDKNDEIYDKLRVWTLDGDGNDRLFALGTWGSAPSTSARHRPPST